MKNNLQKSMMEKNQKKTKRNGVLWGIALGLCALNTQAQTDGQVLTRVAGGSSWANPVTDGDAWGVTGDVITGDIRRTGRVAIGINAAVDALTVTGGNNAGITILGTNAGITNENNQSLIFTKQGTTGTFHFRSGNNFSWENQDGTATHMSLSTNGDLDIANDVRVHGQFRDASGDAGNNTQILSSTGTGTNWVNAPTGDITSVTAGGGLTGTNQNAGAVTIHAAANSGLYVNATADRIRPWR